MPNRYRTRLQLLRARLKLALKETRATDAVSNRTDAALRDAIAHLNRELSPRLEISRCLTLSVRHAPAADRALMFEFGAPAPCSHVGEHGALFYANEDLLLPPEQFNYDESWSPELQAVLRFARQRHCSHVRFDTDAAEIAALPTFSD